MVIGVIGVGVVGGALSQAFKEKFKVIEYDKFKNLGEIKDLLEADTVFICVPTPTIPGWTQDQSALLEVLSKLETLKFTQPIVVKCTVLPGTMDLCKRMFPSLDLVHNPEFLTEANSALDFVNQTDILLSGDNDSCFIVNKIYGVLFENAEVHCFNDFKVTELAKYIHNTFLATKVAFMNEMYDYIKDIAPDKPDLYSRAVSAALTQGKIGQSHLKVPGPDGSRGFGGMCFPKDTKALLKAAGRGRLGILYAAILSNMRIRDEDP